MEAAKYFSCPAVALTNALLEKPTEVKNNNGVSLIDLEHSLDTSVKVFNLPSINRSDVLVE